MKVVKEIVETFEYKGKEITVQKDNSNNHYFVYKEEGKEVIISLKELNTFINSPFSHTTINDNVLDVIERSVKFNDDFIYNMEDLKDKVKKYN